MQRYRHADGQGRAERSNTPKSKPSRVFWIETAESKRLEPRALLTLSVTNFPIPLVEYVQPAGIVTGPDSNLWFAESASRRIARMKPTGELTEFALPAIAPPPGSDPGTPAEAAQPEGMTVGPDGALWFTTADDEIGRITTTGTITKFPVANLTQSNSSITSGPDGNLWFTGVAGNVSRITPAGVVTEFPVPSSGTSASSVNLDTIVTGPDGALWFTGLPGQMGRITTSGTMTEFPTSPAIPPPSGGTQSTTITAAGLTNGPDGALWFTGVPGEVGRMTTAGSVTEFPVPDQGHTAATIVAGPDGNLWFTTNGSLVDGSALMGRITPAGTATTFSVPGNNETLAGLTPGPDGNLWFTVQEDGSTAQRRTAEEGRHDHARRSRHTAAAFPLATTLDPNLGVSENPGAITAGPDGALWFTEATGIGRITTSGAIQQFAIPPDDAEGLGPITAGPDGAVWFGLTSQPLDGSDEQTMIGRITSTGSVSLYPLRNGSSVSSLTAGADGNVWFTDQDHTQNRSRAGDFIGRITPEGTITLFRLHVQPAGVTGIFFSQIPDFGGITSGPDGNVWFTGQTKGAGMDVIPYIGRITQRGRVKMFDLGDVPVSGSSYGPSPPTHPVTGPDGRIWFEESSKGTTGIGRISTRGKRAGFIRNTAADGDLVPLPDGQVFLAQPNSSQLAIPTRSGTLAIADFKDENQGYDAEPYSMTAGPDGNLWFTDGALRRRSCGSRVWIRRTGALDVAPILPDVLSTGWAPTGPIPPQPRTQRFREWLTPGAVITLSVRKPGDSEPLPIGSVQASPTDGSWLLTSTVALANNAYEVTATQQGDTRPPSVLYSLEPDSSGDLSSALIVNTTLASRHLAHHSSSRPTARS